MIKRSSQYTKKEKIDRQIKKSMGISKENKEYLDSLIDYYISEAGSYKQLAEVYAPEIDSIPDTAFGIIAGCVYSSFLQVYSSQNQTAELDDIKEFNKIIKDRAPLIKKAILDEIKETSKDTK